MVNCVEEEHFKCREHLLEKLSGQSVTVIVKVDVDGSSESVVGFQRSNTIPNHAETCSPCKYF